MPESSSVSQTSKIRKSVGKLKSHDACALDVRGLGHFRPGSIFLSFSSGHRGNTILFWDKDLFC